MENINKLLNIMNDEVAQYRNLPQAIVDILHDVMNGRGGHLKVLNHKETVDEKIEFLVRLITRDTIESIYQELLRSGKMTCLNVESEEKLNNKIEVIGTNKELNELAMKKILKGTL